MSFFAAPIAIALGRLFPFPFSLSYLSKYPFNATSDTCQPSSMTL